MILRWAVRFFLFHMILFVAVIGYPLDIVKTRMQTRSSSTIMGGARGGGGGILATGIQLVRTEGIRSLYKGVGPPLVSLSLLNMLSFTSYSYFHHALHAHCGWDGRNAVAGGLCGPLASMISTTENLIKTQMQLDNVQRKQYKHAWDCVQQITTTTRRQAGRNRGGIWSLYTGHGINTARETTFLSTYFFVYEGLRHFLLTLPQEDEDEHDQNSISSRRWCIPVAGGLAGAVAWTVSFPLDCVRARVQGRDLNSASSSSYHVLQQLLAEKGVRGLYSGVGPSILRAFLVSGSRFSAYEVTLWLLRGGRENQRPVV